MLLSSFFIARLGIVIGICGGALIITLGLFTILRIKIITGNFSSPHPLIIVMQQFQNWVRIMRQNLPDIKGEEKDQLAYLFQADLFEVDLFEVDLFEADLFEALSCYC